MSSQGLVTTYFVQPALPNPMFVAIVLLMSRGVIVQIVAGAASIFTAFDGTIVFDTDGPRTLSEGMRKPNVVSLWVPIVVGMLRWAGLRFPILWPQVGNTDGGHIVNDSADHHRGHDTTTTTSGTMATATAFATTTAPTTTTGIATTMATTTAIICADAFRIIKHVFYVIVAWVLCCWGRHRCQRFRFHAQFGNHLQVQVHLASMVRHGVCKPIAQNI